jgi:VWFA-related protein
LVAAALAQQAPPANSKPQTIFRSNVRRVVVDVVVTDSHGQPVKGLKQSDFSISEERDQFPDKREKKEQKILSFDTHDFSTPSFVPPQIHSLPVNTFVDLPKEPERGPLYVLYYDMANLGMDNQGQSRKPLLDFIDNAPAGTRFALFVHSDGVHLIQGFTQDRELLRAAITTNGHGSHVPKVFMYGGNYGAGNFYDTTGIMQYFADYFQGVPGRKNLIWIASEFPMILFADPSVTNLDAERIKRAISALGRSQIALYPVDVNAVGDVPIVVFQQEDAIAEATGGHAEYSNNDIRNMLDKAVDQGSSYYTLSYSPTDQRYDGSQRKIEVKFSQRELAKAGYTLTYRRTYYAVDLDAPPTSKKPDPMEKYREGARQNDTLYASIEHGAPMIHNLVFAAHVRPGGDATLATPEQMAQIEDEPSFFRTRVKKKPVSDLPPVKLQRYLIDYQVIDPMLKSSAARAGHAPTLEFAAAGYDADGFMLNGIANDAVADAASSTDPKQAGLFRVEQEFCLPPEAVWLRVAVRDIATDRTGTVEIRLPLKPEPPGQAEVPSSGSGKTN